VGGEHDRAIDDEGKVRSEVAKGGKDVRQRSH
jgi:hypothetical protein